MTADASSGSAVGIIPSIMATILARWHRHSPRTKNIKYADYLQSSFQARQTITTPTWCCNVYYCIAHFHHSGQYDLPSSIAAPSWSGLPRFELVIKPKFKNVSDEDNFRLNMAKLELKWSLSNMVYSCAKTIWNNIFITPSKSVIFDSDRGIRIVGCLRSFSRLRGERSNKMFWFWVPHVHKRSLGM